MSKITTTKLNRAIFVKGRKNSLGRQLFKIVGYKPVTPRTEKLVTATMKGGRQIRIQVFLSEGEVCNPQRRFKIERKRQKIR